MALTFRVPGVWSFGNVNRRVGLYDYGETFIGKERIAEVAIMSRSWVGP